MSAKQILLEYAQSCRDSASNWLEISKRTNDPIVAKFAIERAADNAEQAEKQQQIAEAL